MRLVYLESEPTMRGRGYQHYEVWDPVDGMLEQGTVAVKDMVTSQPWLDESFDFPVEVESGAVGGIGLCRLEARSRLATRRVVEQRDRRRLGTQRPRLRRSSSRATGSG